MTKKSTPQRSTPTTVAPELYPLYRSQIIRLRGLDASITVISNETKLPEKLVHMIWDQVYWPSEMTA